MISIPLYIVLKQFYTRDSGSMQVADILIALFSITSLTVFIRKTKTVSKTYRYAINMFYFALYAIAINLIQMCIEGIKSNVNLSIMGFLNSNIYLIFNCLVIIHCTVMYELSQARFLRYLRNGVIVSCLLLFINVSLNAVSGRRNIGGFNSPNQLAIYAICIETLSICLFWPHNKKLFLGVSLATIYCILLSLSRGGMIAIFLLIGMTIFLAKQQALSNWRKSIITKVLVLSIVVYAIYFVFYDTRFALNFDLIRSVRFRMLSLDDQMGSLGDTRGYARVFDLNLNAIWGMGEGAMYRYSTFYKGEAHSLLVTILCSYGMIGVVLFIRLIFSNSELKAKNIARLLILMSGIMLFSLSHNSIRNPIMWMSFFLANQLQITEKNNSYDIKPACT